MFVSERTLTLTLDSVTGSFRYSLTIQTSILNRCNFLTCAMGEVRDCIGSQSCWSFNVNIPRASDNSLIFLVSSHEPQSIRLFFCLSVLFI